MLSRGCNARAFHILNRSSIVTHNESLLDPTPLVPPPRTGRNVEGVVAAEIMRCLAFAVCRRAVSTPTTASCSSCGTSASRANSCKVRRTQGGIPMEWDIPERCLHPTRASSTVERVRARERLVGARCSPGSRVVSRRRLLPPRKRNAQDGLVDALRHARHRERLADDE
jgi:hypothetical protein